MDFTKEFKGVCARDVLLVGHHGSIHNRRKVLEKCL